VQLTNAATNEKRTTIAGGSGRYTFSQLLPGSYELSVEAAGFKKFVQQGISLRANETAELSVTLQVGAVNEQIDVTASAALLDTQTADQSVRIEANTVQNLPINTHAIRHGLSQRRDFRGLRHQEFHRRSELRPLWHEWRTHREHSHLNRRSLGIHRLSME